MSYQKELDFAKALALEAGKIMRRYFRAEDIGTEWKEDDTPLTVADTAINKLFIEKAKVTFPEYGILGEEESYEPDRAIRWIVDPIDGTMPFSLGMPWSTFSLALSDSKSGESLLGIVYDPYLDHLFHAIKGGGAFLNGIKLQTSPKTDLTKSYLSASEGLPNPKGYNPSQCNEILRNKGARLFTVYSSAYIATRVATGDLLGAVSNRALPWDIAAVGLIVREAGGLVIDLDGNPRRLDEEGGYIIAANKSIEAELLKAVQAARL